jgi:hypothetical protein
VTDISVVFAIGLAVGFAVGYAVRAAISLGRRRAAMKRRYLFSSSPLPPSPPAEKATARQDQPGRSCTGDGAGDSGGKRHAQLRSHGTRSSQRTAAAGRQLIQLLFFLPFAALPGRA